MPLIISERNLNRSVSPVKSDLLTEAKRTRQSRAWTQNQDGKKVGSRWGGGEEGHGGGKEEDKKESTVSRRRAGKVPKKEVPPV